VYYIQKQNMVTCIMYHYATHSINLCLNTR